MERRTFLWAGGAFAALGLVTGPVHLAHAATGAQDALVDAVWLRASLGQAGLVIVDIRGADDAEADAPGHVPGAVRAPYPGGWMGTAEIPGAVPSPEALQAQIAGLGVSRDSHVVIVAAGTDAVDFGAAARVYWTLKYAGHAAVSILDGGWQGWIADPANPVGTGVVTPVPGDFVPRIDASILTTTDQVAAGLDTQRLLIDARSADTYAGITKSLAATRGGHIPGAINHDSSLFWDSATNRLKSSADLERILPAGLVAKTTPAVTYCDAGHVSATQWFVLHELLGYREVTLYADSMIGWALDRSRDVVR